mmetsp:Transcript_51/g.155  ORF Transcript_51/g.155 Transcript_51/m.155 type:complete len:249 (+) Transcript_51:22-768(+)
MRVGTVRLAFSSSLRPCHRGDTEVNVETGQGLPPAGGIVVDRPGRIGKAVIMWLDRDTCQSLDIREAASRAVASFDECILALVVLVPPLNPLSRKISADLASSQATILFASSREDLLAILHRCVKASQTQSSHGSYLGSCTVAKVGTSNDSTWMKMLLQVPGMGEDAARAIAREYPDFDTFMMSLGHDAARIKQVQQDIASLLRTARDGRTGKAVGPALSKRTCSFFTCTDGDAELGSAAARASAPGG